MEQFRKTLWINCTSLMRFDFWCLGLSFYHKNRMLYNIYAWIMIICGFLYPFSNIYTMVNNMDNFDIFANCMFNGVGAISAGGKMVVMLFQRKHMIHVFDKIEKLQEIHNTEEWSQKEIYSTNKKIIGALIFYYLSLIILFGISMVERLTTEDHSKWRTPIADVSVINTTYSPNFEIAYTYQVLAVIIMSSAYSITDFLIAAITVDMCVQFKIFRRDIKNMFDTTQENLIKDHVTSADGNWIELNRVIKKAVTRHLALIDLMEEIDKFSSPIMFLGIVGSLTVICFAIYYAMVVPMFSAKALQAYFEVGMIAFSLFFISYCGTEITFASTSVATACYEIDFVGTDVRFQRSLMMIIMRCQKPVALSVGGFANLSLPVYLLILRSTYTYTMVLLKSNGDDQLSN